MKSILTLISLLACVSAMASEPGYKSFTVNGTAVNAGTNWAIVPNNGISQQPQITFLSVRALTTGTTLLTSYFSTNQTIEASGLTNSTTTLFVNATNGFAPGNELVITHVGGSSPTFNPNVPYSRYQNEYAVISAVQNTNQIVLVTAPTYAVWPGDVINLETAGPVISIASSASAPTSFTGPGILSGQPNEPWLLKISSSVASTNTIDAANVVWQ